MCSISSDGDTVIGLFANHSDAVAHAKAMAGAGSQEVVAGNVEVNTSYGNGPRIANALGGSIVQ
jgi:hypothetical protein